MKYILSLIIILFCFSICVKPAICNNGNSKQVFDDTSRILKKDTTGLYHVVKIKKLKEAYIIETFSVNDSIGRTIVSLKSKIKFSKKNKIKVGKVYKLKLTPYFDKDYMPGDLYETFIINGVEILMKPGGANVYTTSNIIGIYLVSQEE